MASPQLQMAKDAYKAILESGAKTPQELRVKFEEVAASAPIPPDIKCEKVKAGGVDAEWISAPNSSADRAVLYVHGGGYVIGSVNTHRDLMGRIARASSARVLGLNYRLAPNIRFPRRLTIPLPPIAGCSLKGLSRTMSSRGRFRRRRSDCRDPGCDSRCQAASSGCGCLHFAVG